MKIKIINRQCWVGVPAGAPYGMELYAWDMEKACVLHHELHTTQIEDPEWCILPQKNTLNDFISRIKALYPDAEIICDVDGVI